MGLDQYIYGIAKVVDREVDFDIDEDPVQLAYWRKHPDLHGWMERLYRAKGGKAESFNLSPVKLSLAELTALEYDITFGRLPETSGFFYGNHQDSYREEELRDIEKLKAHFADYGTVYYTSWW